MLWTHVGEHPAGYGAMQSKLVCPTRPIGRGERLRVLHIWADPPTLQCTAAAVEVAALKFALDPYVHAIEYRDIPACTREDLLRALNAFHPHVLHFSGHGDVNGGITLVNPQTGDPSILSKGDLSRLLRHRGYPFLLVLNCCHGLVEADELAGVIEAVIGVSSSVAEPYPIAFSCALYDSIAGGLSLVSALDCAVTAANERRSGDECAAFELWVSPIPMQSVDEGLVGNRRGTGRDRASLAFCVAVALSALVFVCGVPFVYQSAPPLFKPGALIAWFAAVTIAVAVGITAYARGVKFALALVCLAGACASMSVYSSLWRETTVPVPDYPGSVLQVGFGLYRWSLTPEAIRYAQSGRICTARELVEWTTYDQSAIERGWRPWTIHAASLCLLGALTLGLTLACCGIALAIAVLASRGWAIRQHDFVGSGMQADPPRLRCS